MSMWLQCGVVAAGGALGAVARFVVAITCARLFGTSFPMGTFAINLSGSLALGWFLTAIEQRGGAEPWRLAVAVGFLGAYTTFSTWTWESNLLLEKGALKSGTFNLFGSLVLGVIAVRLGMVLGGR